MWSRFGNASLTDLSLGLEAAAEAIEAALASDGITSSQMSTLQMAAAVIEMSLTGDMFIENLSSTLDLWTIEYYAILCNNIYTLNIRHVSDMFEMIKIFVDH